MPLYDYQCPICGHKSVEFMKMCAAAEAPFVDCPHCVGLHGGVVAMCRQVSVPHTSMQEFHKPIEMFSIAMDSDEEIKAFKRKAPDVDVNTDPNHPDYGLPIARSRHQKLQALQAAGYHETN